MNKIEVGTIIGFSPDENVMDEAFARIERLDLNACQVNNWDKAQYTDENAEMLNRLSAKHGVRITALWAGWNGPAVWNFYEGPLTLGIVPKEYRESRLEDLKAACPFAAKIGVKDVITHFGFLPEDPNNPEFMPIAEAIRSLALTAKEYGLYFLFETGQETPVAMLRYIETVGTGNLGVNLDTANLILYGKANTVDALDVFGDYVRNTHFKDGFYPTTGTNLGAECALGEGKANVPGIIAGLKKHNYQGPYIIEREIGGDQQTADIIKARDLIISCVNS